MPDIPHINPTKPVPGGDAGLWGGKQNAVDDAQTNAINTDMDRINAILSGADTSADSFAEVAALIAGSLPRQQKADAASAGTATAATAKPNLLDISAANATRNLPAANSVTAGTEAYFKITAATSPTSPTTAATISPNGADTINGATTALTMRVKNRAKRLVSDGVSNWLVLGGDSDATVEDQRNAGLYSPFAAPSYAGAVTRQFDAKSGLYGLTPANNRTFATALGAASVGSGVCHDVVISDSGSSAFDGAALQPAKAWPEIYRQTLAAMSVPTGGDGLFPCMDTIGTSDPRLVFSANQWTSFSGDFIYTTTNGATMIYTVRNGGGKLVLTYDQSGNKPSFTVKIGSAAAVTVTPNNTNSIGVYSPAGTLAAGTVVTVTASGTFVPYHVGTVGTTGYHMHNLARSSMGATRAADTSYFTASVLDGAWDPTIATGYGAPAQQAYSALSLAGITVSRVTISLLANDLVGGQTPAQIVASLPNIIAKFPGATVRIVVPWLFKGITTVAWQTAAAALYAFADTNACQVLDRFYLLGDYAAMQAAGVLGADTAHTKPSVWANEGRRTALADLAAA